jgi:hypothetical protein
LTGSPVYQAVVGGPGQFGVVAALTLSGGPCKSPLAVQGTFSITISG